MEVVIGAFVGAIFGSLGAIILQSWLQDRREKYDRRQQLVARYLLQLQDACESLYYRLENVGNRSGRSQMSDVTGSDEYYVTSTLYALGRVLALKRILLLDGVYARLEDYQGYRDCLRKHLDEFEKQIDSSSFFRYYRLILAELLIKQSTGHLRPATYLEFREHYDNDSSVRSAIYPAMEFVNDLDSEQIGNLRGKLKTLTQELGEKTRLPSEIEST